MAKAGNSETAAGVGAVIAAALASMCCILPIGLGALGLSGAMLSAFFEPLRPYFLVVAGLFLVLGFYFSYRTSRSGEACDIGVPKISRASRPTLFVASLATAGFALFPSLVGFAAGGHDTLAPEVESNVVVLHVEGMTCESCTSGVRTHLLDVPGVIDAAVSYERKVAEVRVREERAPEVGVLIEAVERAGYTASLETR